MHAQINTERTEVTNQSRQCYNYSSFFLLDEHKERFFSLHAHILFPPLTAQLGRLTLIAPESCGSTSASHPAIIVYVGVGRLEKKEGFAAYGKALYCVSGAEDVWMKPGVVAPSSGLTVKGK